MCPNVSKSEDGGRWRKKMFPQSADKIKGQTVEFVMQGLDVCSVFNVLYTSHTSPRVVTFKNVFYFHLFLRQIHPSTLPSSAAT